MVGLKPDTDRQPTAPRLKIDMDPAEWGEKLAAYHSGSGSATLTFTHRVVNPNLSTQGIAVLENTLELNGGTIQSASSQADAGLSHDGLGHDSNHKVDWRWQTTTPTPTPTPTPEPTPTPTPTGLHVSIEASPDKPLVNESVNLSAVIANAPADSNPSYNWQAEANGAWHSFGNNSTLSFLASKSESWTFRVTVSYGNGDSATSDPLTVTWLNANNRGPVAATKAENYAHFTGRNNAPRGTLVSKDFTGIFTDPDDDDLTYTASVAAEYASLVEILLPGLRSLLTLRQQIIRPEDNGLGQRRQRRDRGLDHREPAGPPDGEWRRRVVAGGSHQRHQGGHQGPREVTPSPFPGRKTGCRRPAAASARLRLWTPRPGLPQDSIRG